MFVVGNANFDFKDIVVTNRLMSERLIIPNVQPHRTIVVMKEFGHSWNIFFIRRYLVRLWLWLKCLLVIPSTYLYAAYCCIVELYIDLVCDPPLRTRMKEWKASSLLNDCPEIKRIAVMTGADGTIGTEVSNSKLLVTLFQITRLLLEQGFEVAIFGMRRPKLFYLKDWDKLHLLKCNFMVPSQVHTAINEFQRLFTHIDLFIFSAGTMFHPDLLNPESVNPHFTVNLLSHALIFEQLRPFMERTCKTSPKLVAISSSVCHLGDLQNFIYGDPRRAFRQYRNGYKSYADSKLYTNLYFRQLANMLRETKIKVVTVHPGVVPGSLYRHVFFPLRFLINNALKFVIRKNTRAAIEVLNLAFDDSVQSGAFYEHFRIIDFAQEYSETELRRLYNAVQEEIR